MKTKLWKAFWNHEKEEKWLNEMAANGMAMTDYAIFRYTFEDCSPGEYIYRLELLKKRPKHPESLQYLRFMEENGVEYIASYSAWVYFRKKTTEGGFEIYSDLDLRIKHYQRIRNLWRGVGILELLLVLSQIGNFLFASLHDEVLTMPVIAFLFILPLTVLFCWQWRSYAKKVKLLKARRAVQE